MRVTINTSNESNLATVVVTQGNVQSVSWIDTDTNQQVGKTVHTYVSKENSSN